MKRFIIACLLTLTCSSMLYAIESSNLVQGIQAPSPAGTPTAPAGLQQKGRIGELISNIFHPSGLIRSNYLTATADISHRSDLAGNIPFWNGAEIFRASIVTQNSARIGIGTTNPQNTLDVAGTIGLSGSILQRNTSPTYYFLDTNQRSAMINVNSNIFTIARGAGTASTTLQALNGRHPLSINLENNEATFGGRIRMPTVTVATDPANTVATKGYVDSILGGNKKYVNEGEDVYGQSDNIGGREHDRLRDTCDNNKDRRYSCLASANRTCTDLYTTDQGSGRIRSKYKVNVTCKAFYYLTGLEQ